MTTYLLLWNPTKPDAWPSYERDSKRTLSGRAVHRGWSTGNNKSMPAGSRIFMVRQYKDRGIIAAGQTTGTVVQDAHWEDPDRDANYVRARWDVILSPDQVLPIETLRARIKDVAWNSLLASGTSVRDDTAKRLNTLWEEHLARLGLLSAAGTASKSILPDEVKGKPATYSEGAVTKILVNAYERNEQARSACISEYGTNCAVCGFDFAATYGETGAGFIHVHHLKNLASIGKSYKVDPIKDLRPVCPNCHCMLHSRDPALSIENLRKIVVKARQRAVRKVPR